MENCRMPRIGRPGSSTPQQYFDLLALVFKNHTGVGSSFLINAFMSLPEQEMLSEVAKDNLRRRHQYVDLCSPSGTSKFSSSYFNCITLIVNRMPPNLFKLIISGGRDITNSCFP